VATQVLPPRVVGLRGAVDPCEVQRLIVDDGLVRAVARRSAGVSGRCRTRGGVYMSGVSKVHTATDEAYA
jgi:hypothetical protein